MKVRSSASDKMFDLVNGLLLLMMTLMVLYPLYFIVIASFSDPSAISLGKVWAAPRGVTLEAYRRIMAYDKIWLGYKNTILYTVVGTAINVLATMMAGYALSRRDLPLRGFYTSLFVFTMFFDGGLIPKYLFLQKLGLYNTFWVMVLPTAVSVWNLVIAKTFFQNSIPNELLEAAVIDGCSDLKFYWKIVCPLSKAIMAVLIVYYAVGHWNEYFSAMIYLKDEERFPLQLFLRQVLLQNQFKDELMIDNADAAKNALIAESMKYGIIIVSSLPVFILYPFMQKYFVKGVMIGAVKG